MTRVADETSRPNQGIVAAIAESIRRERERAGINLSELAARARIAKSTLSQLEAGTGNPSVETLWAICTALDMPFSRLVEPPPPQMHVIRAGSGRTFQSSEAEYAATLLAASPAGARRDIYRLSVQPGAPRQSKPHMAGTREHVVMASGRALVGTAEERLELFPGDYMTYPADTAHIFEALEPDTTAVLIIEHG